MELPRSPNRRSESPGYPRILTAQRRPQPTADGYINVLPYEQHHYEALFRLGGRDDLIGDERVASRTARLANGSSLYRDVAEILLQRSTDDWLELMHEAGIPASRIATVDDLLVDLPLAEHPHAGTYRVVPPLTGRAARVDDVRRPAPLHGEHGPAVLAELGYTSTEIEALIETAVVYGTFAR